MSTSDVTMRDGIERFTPFVLRSLASPPVFRLRAGSRRDRLRYQRILGDEGLIYHSAHRIREEVLAGLKQLWDAATFEQHSARLTVYWEAVDRHLSWRGVGDAPAFDYPEDEAAAIEDLVARVTEAWTPLRRLGADNAEFINRGPEIMLAIVLAGWEGIDLQYRREITVPLDLLDELKTELARAERVNGIGGTDGECGLAFAGLCVAAGRRLFSPDEKPPALALALDADQ